MGIGTTRKERDFEGSVFGRSREDRNREYIREKRDIENEEKEERGRERKERDE